MPGNAVKDFCSRIRENSGFRRVTVPKSHDFGYEKPPVSSKKNPSRRCLSEAKVANMYSLQGIFGWKLLEFGALQSGTSYANRTAPVASARLSNKRASEFYSDDLLIILTGNCEFSGQLACSIRVCSHRT